MVMGRLNDVVSELGRIKDTSKHTELWRTAHSLLKRTNADPLKSGRVIAERSVPALKALVEGGITEIQRMPGLSRPAVPPPSAPQVGSVALKPTTDVQLKPATPPSEDELKSALKAFRKRLKVTQLDAESRMTQRPLTGGSREQVVAIQPPNSHPMSVWEHLAKSGKIKHAGSGLFALVED